MNKLFKTDMVKLENDTTAIRDTISISLAILDILDTKQVDKLDEVLDSVIAAIHDAIKRDILGTYWQVHKDLEDLNIVEKVKNKVLLVYKMYPDRLDVISKLFVLYYHCTLNTEFLVDIYNEAKLAGHVEIVEMFERLFKEHFAFIHFYKSSEDLPSLRTDLKKYFDNDNRLSLGKIDLNQLQKAWLLIHETYKNSHDVLSEALRLTTDEPILKSTIQPIILAAALNQIEDDLEDDYIDNAIRLARTLVDLWNDLFDYTTNPELENLLKCLVDKSISPDNSKKLQKLLDDKIGILKYLVGARKKRTTMEFPAVVLPDSES